MAGNRGRGSHNGGNRGRHGVGRGISLGVGLHRGNSVTVGKWCICIPGVSIKVRIGHNYGLGCCLFMGKAANCQKSSANELENEKIT